MAYLEIKRGDELVKGREIDDALAKRGYTVRIDQKRITLQLGENRQVGGYTLSLRPDSADTADDAPSPAMLVSETDVSEGGHSPGRDDSDAQRPCIPGYEITGRLGSGGMGSVWLATQLSTHRKVAIKIMSQSFFGSEKAQNRFTREVELTARLDHPNIAKVYDSGLNAGNYFYVMEYIEGINLDLYVESVELSQTQILRLMVQVCKAVYHAHLKGVIHRDLKPSNILVTEDGRPHVLDLGLAKSFLGEDSNVQVSIDGEISGTPAYMSPEQARGDLKQIDMRADVYSLGVILFRLLTGQPPHDLSGSRMEVLKRVGENEVRRPRHLKSDLDKELESLLLKALAHDPDARYLSAGDMADDIESFLTGEPLSIRSATTLYFLQKKLRKHVAKVCIGAAITLVLLGVGLYAFSQVIASRVRVKAAVDELEIQRRATELAQAEASSIQNTWQNLERMILEGRTETDVRAAIRALHQEYLTAQGEISNLKATVLALKDIARDNPGQGLDPPGGAVSGHVRQVNGEPISGATVEVLHIEGGTLGQAVTQSDGSYKVGGLPTGEHEVRAFKRGFARKYHGNTVFSLDAETVQVTAPQDTTGIEFYLNEGGSISGHVYDGDTGEPIQGAGINLLQGNAWAGEGFNAVTDSNGFYQVDCLALGIYNVAAHKNGFAQRWYEQRYSVDAATDVKVTPPENVPDINISLYPGGSISGRVVDSNGMPVEGVHVGAGGQLPDGDWIGRGAMTRSDGSYRIENLPPWDRHKVNVHHAAGFVPQWYDSRLAETSADHVTVTEGNDTPGINFTLQAGGSITGHVYDEEDGTPIRNADFFVDLPTGKRVLVIGGTDRDGSYTIWLGPGSYLISASGGGHGHEYYDNSYNAENATIVSVIASRETSGIDFHLSKAGSISGHIYSEEGEPIGNATVYATSNESSGNGTNSRPDGSYTIEGLPTGNYYHVEVSVTGHSPESEQGIIVNAAENVPGIDFMLEKLPPSETDPEYNNGLADPNDPNEIAAAAALNARLEPADMRLREE